MPLWLRIGVPALAAWFIGWGLYTWGWNAREAAFDKNVIKTLERIRDADLSTGDVDADLAFIDEWLRENQ